MRRDIGELDGEGRATRGVIIMRSGKSSLETIASVKAKVPDLAGQPAHEGRNRSEETSAPCSLICLDFRQKVFPTCKGFGRPDRFAIIVLSEGGRL